MRSSFFIESSQGHRDRAGDRWRGYVRTWCGNNFRSDGSAEEHVRTSSEPVGCGGRALYSCCYVGYKFTSIRGQLGFCFSWWDAYIGNNFWPGYIFRNKKFITRRRAPPTTPLDHHRSCWSHPRRVARHLDRAPTPPHKESNEPYITQIEANNMILLLSHA
jgi:hypothetical protein